MIWDLDDDEKYFPATKSKLLQTLSNNGQDSNWLNSNLLEGQTFRNTGDIMSALIKQTPPISWEEQKQSDMFWKYPLSAIYGGQRLSVGENQQAVLVSRNGTVCDLFKTGSYTVSRENCPLLVSQSRKTLPSFDQVVLNGSPVFYCPTREFELGLSVMGQTRALRRVMAQGVARVRISATNQKQFFEQIASRNQYSAAATLTALQKRVEEVVRQEISLHEFDELKSNHSILENKLKAELQNLGLEPVKVGFSSVSEFGPGMFMPSTSGATAYDPKNYEQMRQMAESMKAAQLQRIQAMQQSAGSQPVAMPSQQVATVACPFCRSANPPSSKFCNNCGKPLLQAQKRICPKCGSESEPGIKFCGNCGTNLG